MTKWIEKKKQNTQKNENQKQNKQQKKKTEEIWLSTIQVDPLISINSVIIPHMSA